MFLLEREGNVIHGRSIVLEKWNVLRLELIESGEVSAGERWEGHSFIAGQLFWKNGMS